MNSNETEWVLVEAVSMFRNRYMVEVPKGKSEWASDTVVMDEAVEFSQKYLDETITSSRVLTKEQALELCDADNDYCTGWTEAIKLKNFFTPYKTDDMTTPMSSWTDSEWDKFSIWLNGMLHAARVKVTFTKKDGTVREMLCTLDANLLPEVEKAPGEVLVERKRSPTVMSVYDLESAGWRSFTIKSVSKISIEI